MKGISPLIAAILLIAFTVGVGGLIITWLSGLTTTQTGIVGESGEKAAKCAASALVVEEVRYKAGSNLVNVTVNYRAGSESLQNLSVSVTGGGKTNTSEIRFQGGDFVVGQSDALSVNVTNGATIPPEIVTARALCQKTYGVSGSCKSGETCMKSS